MKFFSADENLKVMQEGAMQKQIRVFLVSSVVFLMQTECARLRTLDIWVEQQRRSHQPIELTNNLPFEDDIEMS